MTTSRAWSVASLVALGTACSADSEPIAADLIAADLIAADRVSADAPKYSDWSAPINLGPPINTAAGETNAVISRDGLSLYFTCTPSAAGASCPGSFGGFDIVVSRRASVSDPWGPPENLGPTINTAFNDHVPTLSPDGHRLYFASDRPGLGANDIYVSRRHSTRNDLGWESPVSLGSGVNSAANDIPSSIFDDDEGGTQILYAASNRAGGMGDDDIYAVTIGSEGTFGPTVAVNELNTSFRDTGPFVRRDGLEMFIASNRPGTAGPLDIWVATRVSTSDDWSTLVNLGSIVNGSVIDGRPALSFDGTELYFQSTRAGGAGALDIWVTTRSKLVGSN